MVRGTGCVAEPLPAASPSPSPPAPECAHGHEHEHGHGSCGTSSSGSSSTSTSSAPGPGPGASATVSARGRCRATSGSAGARVRMVVAPGASGGGGGGAALGLLLLVLLLLPPRGLPFTLALASPQTPQASAAATAATTADRKRDGMGGGGGGGGGGGAGAGAGAGWRARDKTKEAALQIVHDIATGNFGTLCLGGHNYRSLPTPVDPQRYDNARLIADMASNVLRNLGLTRHRGLMDSVARAVLTSERHILATRVLAMNSSSVPGPGAGLGEVAHMVEWRGEGEGEGQLEGMELAEPARVAASELPQLAELDLEPWFEDPLQQHQHQQHQHQHQRPQQQPAKFLEAPVGAAYRGWWTYPYYSCRRKRWLLSYSVPIPAPPSAHDIHTKGFLSMDVDPSLLEINQCEADAGGGGDRGKGAGGGGGGGGRGNEHFQIKAFHGTHKCDNTTTQCVHMAGSGWTRGSYQCKCRPGYFSQRFEGVFNGSLVEQAWHELELTNSAKHLELFKCQKCAPGCDTCKGPKPCLATYNWPFRISLLSISTSCVAMVFGLAVYVYHKRRMKVFKVASPIFLAICLLGCAVMYLELAAIFPVLDLYSCIATKWTRHLGFCITYTALLMKTWRVSLTFRVKSAHKIKLTDKQLLQWMFPILLVMLIFLGAWTLSAPPQAEEMEDSEGLLFKQCQYNWWDHSLSIGEVLFLGWGIKVCYNVRHAVSLYNEARYISYAIYNIALVNTTMVAFHLLIFPKAGPDIKYLLGFIRTQLSTTVTVILVFWPKIWRVMNGLGDQWDNRARARGLNASFSFNGISGLPEELADFEDDSDSIKCAMLQEELQKLAAQLEIYKIIGMELHNRHLKPKPGGYFSPENTALLHSLHLQSHGQSPPRAALQQQAQAAGCSGLAVNLGRGVGGVLVNANGGSGCISGGSDPSLQHQRVGGVGGGSAEFANDSGDSSDDADAEVDQDRGRA